MQVPETEVVFRGAAGAELLRAVVTPGEYVIGRQADCSLQVEADLVSRQHAQLTVNFDHLIIEDLGSANGTFINGRPITAPTRLWPNQKVQIGSTTVEFHRMKTLAPPDVSLAPGTAAVNRLLPQEFLREQKYDIGGVVAQGGMGAILDAREATIERKVAMKVMLDTSSPDDLTRFIAEAKITGQLEHPNVVPVHELSVDENDQVFYTMKFVRGVTLKKVLELMAEGMEATLKKYPLGALLTIFQKVCDAIAFAHSKGVIHRDLKPENIMLGDFGEVLVMDWGLAKVLGSGASPDGSIPAEGSVRALPEGSASTTLAGTVMGTPQYMSPEQARGEVETLDARSDLYALGAILYHLLSLRPPVSGGQAWEVVAKVAGGEVEPLTAPAHGKVSHLPGGRIPDSLRAVVLKAMAPDKILRYAGVAELQADLAAYQNGFATSAERAGLVKQFSLLVKRHKTAALGLAAVLVVGATLGAKAIVEGRRAERALADLKKTAPDLLRLAQSDSNQQHFEAALRNTEAALALDRDLAPAYWQRAWDLLGRQQWAEAVAALRTAAERDPAHAQDATATIPLLQRMAAAPNETERFHSDLVTPLFTRLLERDLTGPALMLTSHLRLTSQQKMQVSTPRIAAWLGPDNRALYVSPTGYLGLNLAGSSIATLEPVRGLPIDFLEVMYGKFTTLEPLRGMRLTKIKVGNAPVTSLEPLTGMQLTELDISNTRVTDLEPLRGMPLRILLGDALPIMDLSPLRGAPLQRIGAYKWRATDYSALAGAPLQSFSATGSAIQDLSFLKNAPLDDLQLPSCDQLADLAPLRGSPVRGVNINQCKAVTDFSPLLDLPKLERISCEGLPKALPVLRRHPTLKFISYKIGPGATYQPVAKFWAEYDAEQAAKSVAK